MFPATLDKALDALDRVVQYLCVAALGVTVVAVFWQVLSRYVTSQSSPWTSDLAAFSFVWLSMFAIALGVRRGRHMVLDIWEYFRYRRWLNNTIWIISIGVVMAVLFLLAFFGIQGLGPAFSRRMPGLGISNGWMSLAVPVGAILSLIFAAEALWKLLLAREGEDPLPQKVLFQDEVEEIEERIVAEEKKRMVEGEI
ncbi:MAG: TRAP transporter small permease [Brooklawnia sp.]|uniref:TRAP transporter small permease n=1 Tax=Brooklawnia sp. TaxID=2699740 RepID=UPI003C7878AB